MDDEGVLIVALRGRTERAGVLVLDLARPLDTYAMRWAFQNRSKASGAPGSSKPSVAAASADARACARASDPPVPGLVMG